MQIVTRQISWMLVSQREAEICMGWESTSDHVDWTIESPVLVGFTQQLDGLLPLSAPSTGTNRRTACDLIGA